MNGKKPLAAALSDTKRGCLLKVKVKTSAGAFSITGIHDSEMAVTLKAVPEKGRANRELISSLSKALAVPRKRIGIARGAASRHKIVCFEDMTAAELLDGLGKLIP